jgi:hypothetical protein
MEQIMKKLPRYLLLAALSGLSLCCESSRLTKEAESKSIDFFNALRNEEEAKLKALYPGFENFESYFKSDSARINSISYKTNAIIVSIHNRFTNAFGKTSEKDITLFFKKDTINRLLIYDSKGLTSFEENDYYELGIKAGCINITTDTTDQSISKALEQAKLAILEKAFDTYLELKKNIKVVTWSWETGYSGSASGKAIVKNNSYFNIPKLKYSITYKDRAGNDITSDDGYVSYDNIPPQESRSFTFYTSYIGNAVRASIELTFEDDLIFSYLRSKQWTGRECDEYFKKHPEKLKEFLPGN